MNPIYEIDRDTTGILLDEAKRLNGEIPFRAPALTLDEFTKNGRRYPKKVLETALAKITNGDGRTIWGSAGHKDEKFEVPDVSHKINKLWIDHKKNVLMCEGSILPTTRGRDLAILVQAGKIGLSVKGFGTVVELPEGKSEVGPDYRLAGIDFTLSPASSGTTVSKANLFESVDFEEITELAVKISEALKTGLLKVDKKIRSLVEIELKKQNIEAVELVDETIKEVEGHVRFVLNEAVRSKIVVMVEDKQELGMIINYDEQNKGDKRNKAIVQEARAAGSRLTREDILKPLVR